MKYEIMLLLTPNLGKERTDKELSEVKKHITSLGGEIFNEDIWGQRELAYPIRKQTYAYYVVLNFELDPAKSKELEKSLNIYPALMRYLITKCPKGYQLVTFAQYEEQHTAELKEKEQEQKEKAEERPRKPLPKVEKPRKIAKAEEPKEEPKKKEEVEEELEEVIEEPKKVEPKDEKVDLEEMDKKLRSIIDDPDITL